MAANKRPTSVNPCEDRYTFGDVLGKGTFAEVRSAVDRVTRQTVAIKIIKKENLGSNAEALKNEVSILKSIHHPHIVNLQEFFETSSKYYLVMEIMNGGELFDTIVDRGHFSEADAATLIRNVLTALQYLHERHIAHRDLKPENLLFDSKDHATQQIKIADFGFAKTVDRHNIATTACGTPSYVAPEILSNNEAGYDVAVDLWSVGVILYILLCGFPPFYDDNMQDLFDLIRSGNFSFPAPYWNDVSEPAKDLIRHLLVVNPKHRLTAVQALAHPWITSRSQSSTPLSGVPQQLRAHLLRQRMKRAAQGIMAINRMKNLTFASHNPSSPSSSTTPQSPASTTPSAAAKKR